VLPGPAGHLPLLWEALGQRLQHPLREYKHFVHEGGISRRLIAPLAQRDPTAQCAGASAGTSYRHHGDLREISGAKYPIEWNGQPVTPMEGRSLVPAFAGAPIPAAGGALWEHEGNRALRIGPLETGRKIAARQVGAVRHGADRKELHDLAEAQPERTREMAAEWERWARRTHALPWPWKPPYGESDPDAAPKRYSLQQGETLRGRNGPQIEGRRVAIEATLDGDGEESSWRRAA